MNRYYISLLFLPFLQACDSDSQLQAPSLTDLRANHEQATVYWEQDGFDSVDVYYGTAEFELEHYASTDTQLIRNASSPQVISNLEPDQSYFIRLVGYAGSNESASSSLHTVDTDRMFSAAGGTVGTGVDWCMSADNQIVDCDSDKHAGQEGLRNTVAFYYTKIDALGNTLPDNADEWSCARDNVTGLLWEVKTDDGGLHDISQHFAWRNTDFNTNASDPGAHGDSKFCDAQYAPCSTEHFIEQVNATKLCGRDDWRLPSVQEMLSLVDYGTALRGVGEGFDNTNSPFVKEYFPFELTLEPKELHTRDTIIGDPTRSWQLHSAGGTFTWHKAVNTPIILVADAKQEPFAYEPAQHCPSNTLASQPKGMFDIDNAGRVIDSFGRLQWQPCLVGQSYDNGYCVGEPLELTWSEAMQHVNENYDGWRVPTVKELASIIDYSCWSPAISLELFAGADALGIHWTSTPVAWEEQFTDNRYTINFDIGAIGTQSEQMKHTIRLVRDLEE